jgi:Flp pilus assembly protein TadD
MDAPHRRIVRKMNFAGNSLFDSLSYAQGRHQQGDLDEAARVYRAVLQRNPREPNAVRLLGVIALQRGDTDEAERLLSKAVKLSPRSADARYFLGRVFHARKRFDWARFELRACLDIEPDHESALIALATVTCEMGEPEAALPLLQRAIAQNSASLDAWYNHGQALFALQRYDEAFESYGRALAIRPDFAEAHLNRGLIHLLHGRLGEGLAGYEWRWRTRHFRSSRPSVHVPHWNGEPIAGKRLLVYAEQGLGDIILGVRFLSAVAQIDAQITFLVQRSLLRLLSALGEQIELCAELLPNHQFDFQIPLMSLPHRLGIAFETIPGDVPYLAAEERLVAQWRDRLGSNGLKIGVAWQGNPSTRYDAGRSFPLAQLAALAQRPNVRLISLQKNHGLDQIARLPREMKIETLGNAFDSGPDAFVDTAAVMRACDLVIAPDTAVAHIAGALGVPVFLALPWRADWRWFLDRSDSPWYPTMRIFRQTESGVWEPVFARMAEALP